MNHYFSHMSYDEAQQKLAEIKAGAFSSKRDGCAVTLVKCVECARMFEEELEEAKVKIMGQREFLCLSCDPDATEPGFTGLMVQVRWY